MKITALLAVSLLSLCPAAEEGHVLARKGGLPPVGTTLTEATVHEMPDAVLALKMGEQEIPGTMSTKEVSNEVVEGLSPTKVRRILTSKTSENRMVIMEQEQPAPEEGDALQGLPVIIEEKDGKWTATLEEGKATEEQAEALEELVQEQVDDTDFAIYGDSPRKPGDKWDVDLKTLPTFGGATGMKGSFGVEFVEVKDFKGTPCAVLKFNVDLAGTTVKKGEGPVMNIKLKGEALSHRSLADLVDLDFKLTGTVTVDGSPAPQATMTMTGPMTLTGSATLEKK
jgi:hypothetical protein